MRGASALRGIVALGASIGLLVAAGVGPVSAEVFEDQVQEEWSALACLQPQPADDCHTGLAQTLTVGMTGQLTAIDLLLERSAETAASLTVEIHTGTPTGSLLADAEVAAADIPLEADWVLVEFPELPSVSDGDVIAIVLLGGSDVGPPAPRWFWGFGQATAYTRGEAWETGAGLPDWTSAPEWDAAFATYVAAGEPACELTAFMGETELEPPIEIEVGQTLDLLFWDFPPFADMEVVFEPADGDPEVYEDMADAFGESWWTWEAQDWEIGDWLVIGSVVDSNCEAMLDVTIVAAPAPTPTPTPPPTTAPTPTAAPTGTQGGITLPPTATSGEAPPSGASLLPAFLVLGATVGVLVLATRRFAAVHDDR